MFCKLLVHPRYPRMAGGVDLVHLTRKGAAAAEFLPHSARLFCRTASHTRSTQLSQRVTIFNTIVFMYTQYFCHFYSTILLHAFKYLSGHLISFEAVRIFLSFGHESVKVGKGIAKEPAIIVTTSPLSSLLSTLSRNDYANDLI